jgi:Ca2+/Na+ antiporter
VATDISPKQTHVTKQKRKNIYLGLYGVFILFLTLALTIYILIFFGKYSTIVWTAVGLLFFVYLISRIYLKEQDKEIDKWYKGEKGETITQNILKTLPSTHTCFEDVRLPGGFGNVDHIVIAPSGVFSLETKYVQPKNYGWQKRLPHDQYIEICDQAYREAMNVKRYLSAVGIHTTVVPVLVMAHPYYKTVNKSWNFKGVEIIPAHLLNQFFNNQKENILNWSQAGAIVESFFNLPR